MALTQVIKYEGDNSTFVWKYPEEDFNSLTQLIVHESQEALFFMNGQALDLFGPGKYQLTNQNIPILGKLINWTTGGVSQFHCEVYFINKTVQMGLKWGTPSKIRFIEPTYGIPVEMGASGEMFMAVTDSRKLLTKMVGTMNGIAWEDRGDGFTKSIQSSFRPLIITAIKNHLPSSIKAENMDILEIDEHLDELSEAIRGRISEGFEEYGLTIPRFFIQDVTLPEDDPNFKKMRELHALTIKTRAIEAEASLTAAHRQITIERERTDTEIARHQAERDLIKAQTEAQAAKMAGFAEAEVMQAKGYNQRDVLQAEVQKAYAEGIGNMGANGGGGGGSGIMGDVLGLGISMAAMQNVASQTGDMFKGFTPQQPAGAAPAENAAPSAQLKCQNCGKPLPENAKFCLECGTKVELLKEDEMICPACGSKTHKGKFCMECGASLVNKCPACGAEVPQGGKFCLECGQKLNGGN